MDVDFYKGVETLKIYFKNFSKLLILWEFSNPLHFLVPWMHRKVSINPIRQKSSHYSSERNNERAETSH